MEATLQAKLQGLTLRPTSAGDPYQYRFKTLTEEEKRQHGKRVQQAVQDIKRQRRSKSSTTKHTLKSTKRHPTNHLEVTGFGARHHQNPSADLKRNRTPNSLRKAWTVKTEEIEQREQPDSDEYEDEEPKSSDDDLSCFSLTSSSEGVLSPRSPLSPTKEHKAKTPIEHEQEFQDQSGIPLVDNTELLQVILDLEEDRRQKIEAIAQIQKEKLLVERAAKASVEQARRRLKDQYDFDLRYLKKGSLLDMDWEDERHELSHRSQSLSPKRTRSQSLSPRRTERGSFCWEDHQQAEGEEDFSLSIKEKKRLELERERAKKELEEEKHLKFRFKARPVPASTLVPKYHEMTRAAEARSLCRKLERKHLISEMQQPFSGVEQRQRKQKARQEERRQSQSVKQATETNASRHRTGTSLDSFLAAMREKARQEEIEKARKDTRDKRARELLRQSQLPKSLQLHAELEQEKKKSLSKTSLGSEECTFRPTITRSVPDFEWEKEKWTRALQRSKSSRQTTRPDVSNLRMFSDQAKAKAERQRQQRAQRLKQEQEEKRAAEKAKWAVLAKRAAKIRDSEEQMVQMTRAQELRLKRIAERKAEEYREEQLRQQQEKKKREQQALAAKKIKAMVEKSELVRTNAAPGYLSLQDAMEKAKEKAKEDQRASRERIKQLKQVKSDKHKASLLQRSSESMRRTERRQMALARVAASLSSASDAILTNNELDQVEHCMAQDVF